MLLFLQLFLFCLLFFLMVKFVVKNDGRNCLYFYLKEYQAEAYRRGIADQEIVGKQAKQF